MSAFMETLKERLLMEQERMERIMEKAKVLKEIESEQFWGNPSLSDLEKIRIEVRELMKFLEGDTTVSVLTDFKDEAIELKGSSVGLLDIRTYKEKVIDYLAENYDNPVINKIKNLEQLTSKDLDELEHILWNELGTKSDYQKATSASNLAVFIRSLVGLDQKAINEKFGQYLNDNVLNAQQQEFIKTVISYVNENGDIETSDLLNTSPFDDQDILELFGEKLQILQYIVNTVHTVVQAAA